MTPREFVEVPADLRDRLAEAIEALLALLDAIDGDPDEEPDLGAAQLVNQSRWAAAAPGDLEHDDAESGLCDGDALAEFCAVAGASSGIARYTGRRVS